MAFWTAPGLAWMACSASARPPPACAWRAAAPFWCPRAHGGYCRVIRRGPSPPVGAARGRCGVGSPQCSRCTLGGWSACPTWGRGLCRPPAIGCRNPSATCRWPAAPPGPSLDPGSAVRASPARAGRTLPAARCDHQSKTHAKVNQCFTGCASKPSHQPKP
eukprot:1187828-Prorocentrum_minimum.AAC.2